MIPRKSSTAATSTASRPHVQTIGDVRTSFGVATYIKVRTEDYRQLSWREVYDAFAAIFPGRWAVEVLPPAEFLVDEANVYHLWVLEDAPLGVDISRRQLRWAT